MAAALCGFGTFVPLTQLSHVAPSTLKYRAQSLWVQPMRWRKDLSSAGVTSIP